MNDFETADSINKSKSVLIRIDRTLAEELKQVIGKNYTEKIRNHLKDNSITWENIRKVIKEEVNEAIADEKKGY